MRCGLLGEKLGHSYSPAIHAQLADYAYGLYEVAPEDLAAFLTGGDFDALNVTIPYKKAVIPYCAELSPIAQKLGSVNVLVRRADGTLYGDNTDAYGFAYARASQRHRRRWEKGARAWQRRRIRDRSVPCSSSSARERRRSSPATGRTIMTISTATRTRSVIVNTTPVGMYPNTGSAAVDLRQLPAAARACSISSITPRARRCCCRRKALGIPCAGGLYMLVAQAKRSCEVFTDTVIDDAEILRIRPSAAAGDGKHRPHRHARQRQEHHRRRCSAERLGRPVLDSRRARSSRRPGMSIPEIFAAEWRGRLPRAGDGRARRARQALGRGPRNRRRQHLPRGKLPAPAPERRRSSGLQRAPRAAAAAGRPPRLPGAATSPTLYAQRDAAVRPLRRRDHRQQRHAGGRRCAQILEVLGMKLLDHRTARI